MRKNISYRNSKGHRHGYQEWYYDSGNLWFRANTDNGEWDGYREFYWSGNTRKLYFYIL